MRTDGQLDGQTKLPLDVPSPLCLYIQKDIGIR